MNKFFKKIKEAYPKCVIHDDKNYLNFSIGATIVYQLRIQKDNIRIMAWNYPKKLKFGEAFKVIKDQKIDGKKVNGHYKILFESGVRNPEIFTLRVEIPYKKSYLIKDEFIEEVIKACEQFHLRLMPLINAFQADPVEKLSKLMANDQKIIAKSKSKIEKSVDSAEGSVQRQLLNGITKKLPNSKAKNKKTKENKTNEVELSEDVTTQFRESFTDEEDLANYVSSILEDFSEKGKIVVLEIKEKDLLNATKNHDLLSGELLPMVGIVGIKSWQPLTKLIGKEESDWVKSEFTEEDPSSIVLLYCNSKYVYAYSVPKD